MKTPVLICDSALPITGGGSLLEEFILYNLDSSQRSRLIEEFASITGKTLNPKSDLDILSGGQKVLAMCLLALLSPSSAIHFVNLWHSLDPTNRNLVQSLISRLGAGRRITHSEDKHDN